MKIKSIELKNFKRFTDLAIADIPSTSKLVLMIGSNGSGKSSLFDAFNSLNKDWVSNQAYYKKNKNKESSITIDLADHRHIVKIDRSIIKGADLVQKFFGRSSIRIIPRMRSDGNPSVVACDQDSPATYIDQDFRFVNDVFSYVEAMDKALREPVFSGRQADTLKIFYDSIKPLNDSLLEIFGDEKTTIQIAEYQGLSLQSPPKLIFKKGDAKVDYDLLSHGEKQVVILLINFIVRRQYYDDSIIFIDEMDSHLSTSLQYKLIEEILTRWIPDSAQLWTASHSLGFIDYARNSDIATIIDFDLLDFDEKQTLKPVLKEKLDVYEIAIPKATITSILKGYTLVHVENTDHASFNLALGEEGYLFLPANNNSEVFRTAKLYKDQLCLRDRDYLQKDEINQLVSKLPNLKILTFYCFENYIYHPDNIAELDVEGYKKEDYLQDIARQKNEKIFEIVAQIATSRQHYVEFKDDCVRKDENIQTIIDSLRSDQFEDFYPYFNMKKYYHKTYLEKFNITRNLLVTTTWFKQEILSILKPVQNR